jgi:hypothetical protein
MKELLNKPRAWLLVSILGALLIVLLGWLLLVSPQMSKASTLQAETVAAQDQTTALRAKEAALKKQAEQLPAMEAELRTLYEKLPNEAGVDALIKQIDEINRSTSMTVTEFSVDPPAPVALPEAAAAAPAPEATGGEAATGDEAAAAAAAAAAAPAPAALLSYSTVTLALKPASFNQAVSYLNSLENLDRAFLITNVDVVSDAGDGTTAGGVTLNLTGRIYVRPPTAEEEQAAAEASASASPSATP